MRCSTKHISLLEFTGIASLINEMVANAPEYDFKSTYIAGISIENLSLHYRRFFMIKSGLSATVFLYDF